MIVSALLSLAFSLPRLQYTWPSKVLERKENIITYAQPFHDYRKENNQLPSKKGLSVNEKEIVEILVYYGILDNTAISVILGNIKQESNFNPLAYNSYEDAVGLIQWRLSRKRRLETYCPDISSVRCQMHFAFSEPDFKVVENDLKSVGMSMDFYQEAMRKYLRFGHFGNRLAYAKQYLNILSNG